MTVSDMKIVARACQSVSVIAWVDALERRYEHSCEESAEHLSKSYRSPRCPAEERSPQVKYIKAQPDVTAGGVSVAR
jgi:hypothetical protein